MAEDKRCIDTRYKGGLGLALSGGGFRASLFHIGVLARLAECGRLKDVVALSTVSGGSIIGAQYYLHLKKLLESKTDKQIVRQDYIDIVKAIERDFLASVQENIRMRTFLDMEKNFRMFHDDYSRSDRLGELYDEYFYQGILEDRPGKGMIQMRELLIEPKGFTGKSSFHPMRNNATRTHKVPVLLINATTLNDGHSWVFEARTLGEPPHDDPARKELDKNWRLCRPDDYDNTTTQKDFELGMAVAASACVPGIFPPLAVSGLYAEGVRVELVDGGVHDNQGIQSLIDRGCDEFIVSDASGQMENDAEPATNTVSVLLRTNNILMDRVREEQLIPHVPGQAGDMVLMHLRKDLPPQSVDWIDRDGGHRCLCPGDPQPDITGYDVPAQVQDLLSKIRTDLDAFNDVEAYSLMLDGYRMTAREFAAECGEPPADWTFLTMARRMDEPGQLYLKLLETASKTFAKPMFLSWQLKVVAGLAVVALIALLAWYFIATWGTPLIITIPKPMVFYILLGVIILLLPSLGNTFKFLRNILYYPRRLRGIISQACIAVAGAVLVRLYLRFINPIYLKIGK